MKSILMQTVFIIPAIQSQQQPRLYANNKHVKQTNKQTNKQTKKVQDRRVSQAYCKHVQFDELSFWQLYFSAKMQQSQENNISSVI